MCSWWGAVVSAKSAAEKKSMSSMATATASPRLTASPTNRNRKLVRIPEAPKRDLLSFVSVGRHALSPGHVLTIRSPRVGRRPFPSRRVSRRRKRQPLSLRGRCSFDARRRSVPLALQDGAACGILGAAERRDVHQRIRLCEAGPQDPPREVPRRPSVGGAGRARPGPPPDARQGVDPPGEPAQVRRRSTGCGAKDRGADPPGFPGCTSRSRGSKWTSIRRNGLSARCTTTSGSSSMPTPRRTWMSRLLRGTRSSTGTTRARCPRRPMLEVTRTWSSAGSDPGRPQSEERASPTHVPRSLAVIPKTETCLGTYF